MLAEIVFVALSAATPVFSSPSDGFHTFRIPALLRTSKGSLLALAEGRQSPGDQAGNVIVLRRSLDQGRSWSNLQRLAESPGGSYNNPCLVQNARGEIVLHIQFYPPGAQEYGVKPGTVKSFQLVSKDEGITWTKPTDIMSQVMFSEASTLASGPGVAIRLERGRWKNRIVMPFNHRVGPKWTVYCAISDDHGRTWRKGQLLDAPKDTNPNEVQVVELAEGGILLNARNQAATPMRMTAISHDGGESFSRAELEPKLVDPICQASIFRLAWPTPGRPGVIAFSNPDDPKARKNGTLRLSFDEGRTWPVSQVIEPGSFQYSCLAMTGEREAVVLYEAVAERYQIVMKTIRWGWR